MKTGPSVIFHKIILPLFVILLSSQAIAQDQDLVINADAVSYDKANHIVSAQGSVEVKYKDVIVYGNDIIYDTQSQEVHAKQGFELDYNGLSLEGETLDYNVKDKMGVAEDIHFNYEGFYFTGKKIDLATDKLELKEASFTTCDLVKPHYHISARDVIFYPKYGWLVGYWGYFWLNGVPVVPMPTYIYDMYANQKSRKNIPPFPDIGSNDDDGIFINERLAWHIRRELSGSYTISYATKKGLGGGAEADYIIDDDSLANLRLYWNGNDGFWGGATSRLFFGDVVSGGKEDAFSFIVLPKYRRYELETTCSYHERINYQRVSYYPNLVLRSRDGQLFGKEVKYNAEVMAGMVAEQSSTRLARGGTKIDLHGDFPETQVGKIIPTLGLDARYYSNGEKWIKTTGGVNLAKDLGDKVKLGLGYLHYFSSEGQSPFNFEMYRFVAGDRFLTDLFFLWGETGVGIHTSYFTDNWSPEDIDYSLHIRMHCYSLIVTYRSLRGEFLVESNLLAL
ncbi:MAG: LPS-assembly protein LptD [Candidatus Saganbacteria bacterium]|nr:LPS-assembly protein LptD [Candidatus Saganbacteria bacterium]